MRSSLVSLVSILAVSSTVTGCTQQPSQPSWAVVTSITPHANPKFKPDEMIVTATTPDGASGTRAVLRGRLDCKVGDTVRGVRQGVTFTPDESACQR